jgi:hypothetical protein
MSNAVMEPKARLCAECGNSFQCGHPDGGCWCSDFPRVMPLKPDAGCLCPACLAKAVARRIGDLLSGLSHEDALKLAAQHAGGRVIEHIDYTLENGDAVFTSWFLLKQGSCCGNGCRNCPYPGGPAA